MEQVEGMCTWGNGPLLEAAFKIQEDVLECVAEQLPGYKGVEVGAVLPVEHRKHFWRGSGVQVDCPCSPYALVQWLAVLTSACWMRKHQRYFYQSQSSQE